MSIVSNAHELTFDEIWWAPFGRFAPAPLFAFISDATNQLRRDRAGPVL
jgi:hypothetical protein